MPTPSEETRCGKPGVHSDDWSARSNKPRRSVFGNYRAEGSDKVTANAGLAQKNANQVLPNPPDEGTPNSLQAAIDLALAGSFIYRLLAKAYEDPSPKAWRWLSDAQTIASLRSAATVFGGPILRSAETFIASLQSDAYELFLSAYLAAFGHAARGTCPLNEIEFGDIKADPLFQPHRLADLAAFYRAFGLEVAEDADERHDHISLELEFLCVLAAKEAYTFEYQIDTDLLALCHDAQKKFLREHLGRWVPAFTRRLASLDGGSALAALANFTRAFIEAQCARFGVAPGSEDLLLRPADEAAEKLCSSCGVPPLPPGALAAGAIT